MNVEGYNDGQKSIKTILHELGYRLVCPSMLSSKNFNLGFGTIHLLRQKKNWECGFKKGHFFLTVSSVFMLT